jgi:hypothetical protein
MTEYHLRPKYNRPVTTPIDWRNQSKFTKLKLTKGFANINIHEITPILNNESTYGC